MSRFEQDSNPLPLQYRCDVRKKVARKKFEIHRGEMVLYFYSFDREANHALCYQIKQHGKYNFEFTVTAFEFNVSLLAHSHFMITFRAEWFQSPPLPQIVSTCINQS